MARHISIPFYTLPSCSLGLEERACQLLGQETGKSHCTQKQKCPQGWAGDLHRGIIQAELATLAQKRPKAVVGGSPLAKGLNVRESDIQLESQCILVLFF